MTVASSGVRWLWGDREHTRARTHVHTYTHTLLHTRTHAHTTDLKRIHLYISIIRMHIPTKTTQTQTQVHTSTGKHSDALTLTQIRVMCNKCIHVLIYLHTRLTKYGPRMSAHTHTLSVPVPVSQCCCANTTVTQSISGHPDGCSTTALQSSPSCSCHPSHRSLSPLLP